MVQKNIEQQITEIKETVDRLVKTMMGSTYTNPQVVAKQYLEINKTLKEINKSITQVNETLIKHNGRLSKQEEKNQIQDEKIKNITDSLQDIHDWITGRKAERSTLWAITILVSTLLLSGVYALFDMHTRLNKLEVVVNNIKERVWSTNNLK